MMPEMIVYLLKVNTALLLFYAGYHFILQRYTFHTLNRFYLLVGMVYSALYPLIDLSVILNRNHQLKEKVSLLAADWEGSVTYIVSQAEDRAGNYWQIVLLIFWTGVIVMSMRLLIQLISLLVLHIRSTSSNLGNVKFRKISKAVNPFSFWRTIYLNPECHEASELRSILQHEQVHVKQLHTLDILLAELSTIFYWFNPGVWLMKKAVKFNLEFITDQEVIKSGVDSKEYQYALLKTQLLPQNYMPVNNFHFLTIKKRIAMMNKKPTNRINLGGYILILPAIMLLVLMTGTSKAAFEDKTIKNVVSSLAEITDFPELLNNSASTHKTSVFSPKSRNLDKLATENRDSQTEVAPSDTNKIEIKTLKGEGNNITRLMVTIRGSDTVKTIPKGVAYFVDGVRMTKGIGHIKPDSIFSVNVMKGTGATSIYGIETANGVIDIIDIKTKSAHTKQFTSAAARVTDIGRDQSQKISLSDIDNKMILLDGKEISKAMLDDIQVTAIESIEIFKGTSAITKYGEKGKNGVIVVTTKKN